MSTVGLFDILVIDRSHGRFTFICDAPSVPCDANNLVVKAVAALADSVAKGTSAGLIASWASSKHLTEKEMSEEARDLDREPSIREGGATTDFGLSVALQKRIPVGAGLGGGSSDGAFTLIALNRLWNLNWPRQRLMEIAKSIGSDVPFFLNGPSAIVRGRGEEVEKFWRPAIQWVLLVVWPKPLTTAQVYGKFDEMGLGSKFEPEPPWEQWLELESQELLPRLANDLEPAAFAIDPSLGRARVELEQLLARPVRMSGSGSTLFSLYSHLNEAQAAAKLVMEKLSLKSLAVELAPQE